MAQINKPTDYFNTKLYTGNGTTDTAITGVGFQPDWTVIKRRNSAGGHFNFDVIRGATKRIAWNETSAEETQSENLKSFDSDGFTLGNASGVNGSGDTHVAWNWLADNTSGSSNTDGDETSTVSVNTTSGFSIVSWTSSDTTGATIGHGLGVAPKIVIIKNRSTAQDWIVYHSSLGATKALKLNLTDAQETSTGFFQDTAPTSTTFRVGSNNNTRGALGNNMIAYCFAEKKGFSKFGSYTGNGSTDGTFVYTGFKPAFVISKRTDSADNWSIYDNTRDTYNVVGHRLYTNSSASETVADRLDFLSTGFKQKSTGGENNASGGSYIYMAFASEPLVGTNNIPSVAR